LSAAACFWAGFGIVLSGAALNLQPAAASFAGLVVALHGLSRRACVAESSCDLQLDGRVGGADGERGKWREGGEIVTRCRVFVVARQMTGRADVGRFC